MNPDYQEGLRAYDRGEPFDPKQRGQWRRGWMQARENRVARSGYSLFDQVALERAATLRIARNDPLDPDAAQLEAQVERKRQARLAGSEKPEDWT